MDWPILMLAAAPGLVIHLAGFATMLGARAPDPAASLRGGRMMLIGFALFALGPAIVLAAMGASRGDPLLVAAPLIAVSPAVVLGLWFERQLRLKE